MPNLVNVLNTIRENASAEYRERVPEATQTNLVEVGNPIINYEVIGNEFLSELVNRIALTIVNSRVAKNPLSILKKGSIPLGQDVQDIFVNMAKGEVFDKDSMDLLKNYTPDVKSVYYRVNRRDKYPVTVSYEMLKTAFTSYENLEKLLNGIVNSLYSGDNYDEYLMMKNLVVSAVYNGVVKCEKVEAPTDEATGKAFVKKLRTLSGLFKFPSAKFNKYKTYAEEKGLSNPTNVVTWCPIDSQILLIKSEILSSIDVDVLASAFNMSRADFIGRVVEVDSFDASDKIQAIICDEAFFQVWDNLTTLRTFENADNLTRKYILHRWETLAVSPFANAVCLLSDLDAPTKITAQDISLKTGESKQIELDFEPKTDVVDKSVTFSTEDTDLISVNKNGMVTAVSDGEATVTITSTADNSVSKTITVLVTETE